MCWWNVIAAVALETGALHADGAMSTTSGSGRLNAPLARWPGSETVSAALPAVLMMLAVVDAVESRATPGTKAPKLAGARSESESVGGTVPETSPLTLVL